VKKIAMLKREEGTDPLRAVTDPSDKPVP
jgi:hypothetical protein